MPYRGRRTSDKTDLSAVPPAQRERLACIDFYLQFTGEISRRVIVERFGVTSSMAVRDLAAYRALAPNNVAYHAQKRRHVRLSTFAPLFDYDLSAALAAFEHIETSNHRPIAHVVPYRQDRTRESCASAICRAINLQRSLETLYLSPTRGPVRRTIVPHSLINSGTRWHVRAFDRDSGEFRDFALSRFIEVDPDKPTEPVDPNTETIDADQQWQKIVDLNIAPHPDLTHPTVVMVDYGITEQGAKISIRAALAGYLLRRWRVDCSRGHRLHSREYPLWLTNVSDLANISSLHIAPGYWLL